MSIVQKRPAQIALCSKRDLPIYVNTRINAGKREKEKSTSNHPLPVSPLQKTSSPPPQET